MSEGLKRKVQILLQLEGTPHRIALAFGIGVFIAFSPFFGLHTALALAVAYLFRLSRTALVVGAYVNNPWTVAPLYTAGTVLGSYVLGISTEGLSEINWDLNGRAFYQAMIHGLRPYVWPFIVGNTALGALAGIAAYAALRTLLARRRQVAPQP